VKLKTLLIAILLPAVIFTACSDSNNNNNDSSSPTGSTNQPTAQPTPVAALSTGIWGEPNLVMQTKSNSTVFNFSCSSGFIEGKILIDSNGNFSEEGSYSYHLGEGQPVTVPAQYSGNTNSDRSIINLTLTYQPPLGENPVSQNYTLKKGFNDLEEICPL
jgi:hypothetical protein